MLEAEKSGEENSGEELGRGVAHVDYREKEYAVEEAVILEMNMVDDEESGREENRERRSVCRSFLRLRA